MQTISIKRAIVFISLLVFFNTAAFSADAERDAPKSLRVEVEGLRKTIEAVIVRAAELRHRYVPEEGLNAEHIRQRLLNTHLFSDVEVEVEELDDEVIVHITVKERWTLVPVPVFYSNKEETGGGGMLFEPNLLGRRKILLAGAIFSNRGEQFQLNYLDQNFLDSKWVVVTRGAYAVNLFQRFSGNDEVFAYRQSFTNIAAGVGYNFADKLIPTVGAMYRRQQTASVDGYPEPPGHLIGNAFFFNMRYSRAEYTSFYDKGLKAMVTFDQATELLGADRIYAHLFASGNYTMPVATDLLFRIDGEAGTSWGRQNVLTYYKLGGKVGARGLPNRGIWVTEYGTLSMAVEKPLYRHRWATLTATQFGDLLVTKEDVPVRSYPGIGLGLRIYLKQIAIPAVGVDGAFSTWTNDFRVSAFVGKPF